MSKSKAIGTAAERAVVRYLQAHGWPAAERRALRGREDAGDIAGTPGICWEVKGGEMARRASDLLVADWLAETDTERDAARADAKRWHDTYQEDAGARDAVLGELLELLPGAQEQGSDAYDQIPRGIQELAAAHRGEQAAATEWKRLHDNASAERDKARAHATEMGRRLHDALASAAITWHECGRTLRHLTRQRNPEGGDQ